jgi:glycosyltransferase involved in cell wall biosynthesis
MKLALVTDAWLPQVNGVVTTLVELVRALEADGHEVLVIEPGQFRTRPCPGYAGIDLAVRPQRQLSRQLDDFAPDAIHLATEGPLGWAGRRHCLRRGLHFTTAFHTRFPDILRAALGVPLWLGYALFRHFHRPSSGVMVPTQGVLELLRARGFGNLRAWTHGVDTHLFDFRESVTAHPALGTLPRPVLLYVGRVSYEKNIEAFLSMDFPGSKVVCGVGPLETQLRERFRGVHWMGLQTREELARIYAAADVFAFPSRSETFGLVMLEAMATGTPVAAYPEEGPLEVLGGRRDGSGAQGGALHEDLRLACYAAMGVPRHAARQRALSFSWAAATASFMGHLVPARAGVTVMPASRSRHETGPVVTSLSSDA